MICRQPRALWKWNTSGSQLQRSVNGGAYLNVTLPSVGARGVTQQLAIGPTYRYRLLAYNTTGNRSVRATGPTFAVRPYQENHGAIVYSAGWKPRAAQGTA